MKIKKRVLISGGAGFIGSHTADLLLTNGYEVRVLDNLSSKGLEGKWPSYLNKRIERIKGDVRFKKDWEKALKDVDYVIHLAALMDILPEFSKFFDTNAVGTANLYEVIVAKKLPIKKIVVASSQFVYGQGSWRCQKDGIVYPDGRDEKDLTKGKWDPVCPVCKNKIEYLDNNENKVDPPNQYAISKYTQELIALKLGRIYKIPSVALRYSIVHGARQSIKNLYSGALRQFVLYLMFNKQIGVYEDGNQLRDFVSVKDVAMANLIVMENQKADYQVFNVGGGKNYTVIELAKMVGKIMKKKVDVIKSGEYRVGDIRHGVSSITKLNKLGWIPKHQEEENIKDFIKWVKSLKPTIDLVEKGINELKKKVKLGKIS